MWQGAEFVLPHINKKQPIRLAVFTKIRIFAVALSYGVMVAQQVLVLFVVVRIRLGQRLRRLFLGSPFCLYCYKIVYAIPIKEKLWWFESA